MKKEQTYSEQLKDPKWQKKRLEVLTRDDWTCKDCGDKESSLQVHHKHYEYGKKPWDYELDILVTLCENCHKGITEYKKAIKHRIDVEFVSNQSLSELDTIISCLLNIDVPTFILWYECFALRKDKNNQDKVADYIQYLKYTKDNNEQMPF